MKKPILITLVVLMIIVLIGTLVHESFFVNTQLKSCTEKAHSFFEKMNTSNYKLDYSFANNDTNLKKLLGDKYTYISSINNNCYAVVKNFNPWIDEYRYSILNIDTETLVAPAVLQSDLESQLASKYTDDFVSAWQKLFFKQ